jgi:hypothetical protein
MNIVFTNTVDFPDIEKPKPASSLVPDWYKNTESYVSGEKKPTDNGETTATIKKCMPVFDAITAGYIITLPADVFVTQKDGAPYFAWSDYNLVSFHPVQQAPIHPSRNNHIEYPKWMNPWSITTPKGYSTMFVQPFHRESVFTILPGIVDTDKYTPAVNFPFVLNDTSFEGLIPMGTPIAQVIPFKRDSWKMGFGTIENIKNIHTVTKLLQRRFFDRYKNMFWSKKEFR